MASQHARLRVHLMSLVCAHRALLAALVEDGVEAPVETRNELEAAEQELQWEAMHRVDGRRRRDAAARRDRVRAAIQRAA